MRIIAILALALLAACGGDDSPALDAGASGAVDLTVRVKLDPDKAEPAREGTLRCGDETTGTGFLSEDAKAACDTVAKNRTLLIEGPPSDAICTEQYGGPEVATVTGSIDGKAVNATFTRTNGCRISEWESLQALLGPPGQGAGGPVPIGS